MCVCEDVDFLWFGCLSKQRNDWKMVVKALKLQRSVSQHVKKAVLDSDSAAGEYNERISTEWDGYKCVFIGF